MKEKESKKNNGFVIQAAILAAAGLFSRVIGLLYGSAIFQIIKKEGNGYYGSAYDIYFLILLISSYSIPTAVSKIISQRLALEEYKNAKKLFKCSLFYVIVVGLIGAIATYVFAPYVVNSGAVLSLRIMAPTIFFAGILGVFRGYMQAHNTMVPTAISQIIEQIINALVSVGAAFLLTRPFGSVEGLDKATATLRASRGAAGSALGTGAGVLAGLIFILINYLKKRREFSRKVELDNHNEKSYRQLFRMMILIVTPVIIATCIYNVSSTIDMKLFWWIVGDIKGMESNKVSEIYGMHSRNVITLINLPIAIAAAVSSALIPGISGAYSKNDVEGVKIRLNQAIRVTMMVLIPAMIGMCMLSNPIMQLLFKGVDKQAAYALSGCSISVVFYALSTITNGVLQGMGKVNAPVKNAAIALVVHVLFVMGMLYFTDGTLSVLAAGTVLYSLLMCVFNQFSIKKYLNYKMNFKRIYVMPTISALIMGVAAVAVYKGIYMIVSSNIISLFIAIIIAIIIYACTMLLTGACTEEDLLDLPKGGALVRLTKKLHLLRK